ncbi:outer membrane protein assembly factor BamB family protein [Halocalculus aciditolerans]|uniref:outer membrane protein assembly factor BamB family protein n=1 Tax=Halocalculus aciditolerans TaxID=1383812 RepID=UPI002DDC6707|nr:PQQ-binding-like beta-propeller repeat protein [Halocalculus aciditolerans]
MPSHTRRQLLTVLGSTSIALAGCLSPSRPSGDLGEVTGAWEMVGRTPGHTRRAPSGPSNPDAVWQTDLDQVRATGTPAVSAGNLYVPVDAISETARHRYRIHALRAATGEERWQVPLRAEPNGPPAVSSEHIVVTAKRALEKGRIVGFQTRYGDEDWLVDIDARLTAPPTIADGVVYVPDWSGRVHALAVGDGSVRWSHCVDAAAGGRTFTHSGAVLDETLYLGSRSGKTGVVALDAATGEKEWKESTRAVTGGPVAHPNGVVVQSHQLVTVFDTDGTRQWSFNIPEAGVRPIAVDSQHLYVSAGSTVYAIDWEGQEAWTYKSPSERVGTPTVAGETVLIRSEERLTAISRATGDEQWSTAPGGTSRVIVTPEAIFSPGSDGSMSALGEG